MSEFQVTVESVKEAIQERKKAWDKFTEEHEEFKDGFTSRLEKLEIAKDTPEFQSSGTNNAKYDVKAFETFLRTADPERAKAMSIATDTSGGYTHVRELGDAIIKAVGEINPLMNEVSKVVIDANEYRQLFTLARSGSGRSAESGTRSETSTATFEKTDVTLYDLYAYPKITNELLHSSEFNLDGWIRKDIAEAFNEDLGTEFITGDGSSKSVGLLNSVSTNVLGASPDLPWGSIHARTASPVTVTYDRLLDLIYSLPARYRAAGNCKFFMSTSQIEAVRGLKDQNDLPIWRQDFGITGAPMVLLGYPVVEVSQLEAQTHGILFGDMKQSYAFVRHNRGLGFIVDQITAPGFTKFYASLQCAGGVMDSRAMVALDT